MVRNGSEVGGPKAAPSQARWSPQTKRLSRAAVIAAEAYESDLKSIARARSRPQGCPQYRAFESVSRSSRNRYTSSRRVEGSNPSPSAR
jgi:copper oxidase (laccase) domain-containing protein